MERVAGSEQSGDSGGPRPSTRGKRRLEVLNQSSNVFEAAGNRLSTDHADALSAQKRQKRASAHAETEAESAGTAAAIHLTDALTKSAAAIRLLKEHVEVLEAQNAELFETLQATRTDLGAVLPLARDAAAALRAKDTQLEGKDRQIETLSTGCAQYERNLITTKVEVSTLQAENQELELQLQSAQRDVATAQPSMQELAALPPKMLAALVAPEFVEVFKDTVTRAHATTARIQRELDSQPHECQVNYEPIAPHAMVACTGCGNVTEQEVARNLWKSGVVTAVNEALMGDGPTDIETKIPRSMGCMNQCVASTGAKFGLRGLLRQLVTKPDGVAINVSEKVGALVLPAHAGSTHIAWLSTVGIPVLLHMIKLCPTSPTWQALLDRSRTPDWSVFCESAGIDEDAVPLAVPAPAPVPEDVIEVEEEAEAPAPPHVPEVEVDPPLSVQIFTLVLFALVLTSTAQVREMIDRLIARP